MKNRIFSLLLVLALLLTLPVTAYAENTVDLDKDSSITVRAVYKKNPLKDLKLNCIRVGDLIPDGDGYYFNCKYDRNLIFTSENIHDPENPSKILRMVKESNDIAFSQKADEKGNIIFKNLKPGLFLIYQKEPQALNGMKYEISPFVVTIPYEGNYHVNASSKPALDLYPENPPPPTPNTPGQKPPQKLPQTGQLTWPIPWMASSGMLIFVFGWWLFSGRRKESYET